MKKYNPEYSGINYLNHFFLELKIEFSYRRVIIKQIEDKMG